MLGTAAGAGRKAGKIALGNLGSGKGAACSNDKTEGKMGTKGYLLYSGPPFLNTLLSEWLRGTSNADAVTYSAALSKFSCHYRG